MTITLEVAAIILSIVSFIVTIFGFFASLKFYRDGVELQRAANDALAKMSEKTEAIQLQVGGMFDKTLDAALGQHHNLTSNFEDLDQQLAATKEALLNEVRGQIGEAGEKQQQRIKQTVEEQIRLLKEKVELTKESAEELAESSIEQIHGTPPAKFTILDVLKSVEKPVSIGEIGQLIKKYGVSLERGNLSRRIRELIREGAILETEEDDIRKYYITELGKHFIRW